MMALFILIKLMFLTSTGFLGYVLYRHEQRLNAHKECILEMDTTNADLSELDHAMDD